MILMLIKRFKSMFYYYLAYLSVIYLIVRLVIKLRLNVYLYAYLVCQRIYECKVILVCFKCMSVYWRGVLRLLLYREGKQMRERICCYFKAVQKIARCNALFEGCENM